MNFIGKYVCYGNDKGGFCWGKIKSEVRINTPEGEKPAFILTDRMTCQSPPYEVKRVRHHDKETLVRKDLLNLERDIVEKGASLLNLSEDELFVLMMGGEVNGGNINGQSNAFMNILKFRAGSHDLMDETKEELKRRLDNNSIKNT
jgi:hypothetical protein